MSENTSTSRSRRDFLSGRALRAKIEDAGSALADEIIADDEQSLLPAGGSTVRLATRAMACEFCVIMNPGPAEQVMRASDALDMIHGFENLMTVYRDDSDLALLNQRAYSETVRVESELFDLLVHTASLCGKTVGAFDPTSGPLIALWLECRREGRIPNDDELTNCLAKTGIEHVTFDIENRTVRFDCEGVELNLGGIGKGYALDRSGEFLRKQGFDNWLYHGGHSSILAAGDHNGIDGWPVGIRNPLFTQERLATIVLKDCAMSTSGSNIQYFRHQGQRYGHILDPRTGQPADELLSVTVLAPTAAEADALSTAFFVLGVEKTLQYCDNHAGIGVMLIPPPHRGRHLEPILCGIPDEVLFFLSK